MPQFRNQVPINPYFFGSHRQELKLNDEWTLVFMLSHGIQAASVVVCSIEIHRRNTVGEFSVSGEFILQTNFGQLPKRFSTYITDRSSFTNLSEKQTTCSEDGETQECHQLKFLEKLSKDFEQILEPGSACFADVTLKCDSAYIPAHKIILSVRSPVFAAMFVNPMKECLQNEVDITDVDEPTMRALLAYIYTGKISDLTFSSAADLLTAADKYDLQELKAACSIFLENSVSVRNVWEILVLGDMHSADLKSVAVDYICNKCGEFSVIEKTKEWKDLLKKRSGLAMEILVSLVRFKDEKLNQ